MRIHISIDSLHRSVHVDSWRGSTTLGELIEAVGGPRLGENEQVYIDAHLAQAEDTLEKLPLLEGSRIARSPYLKPLLFRGGW